jgi:hypothetical protein
MYVHEWGNNFPAFNSVLLDTSWKFTDWFSDWLSKIPNFLAPIYNENISFICEVHKIRFQIIEFWVQDLKIEIEQKVRNLIAKRLLNNRCLISHSLHLSSKHFDINFLYPLSIQEQSLTRDISERAYFLAIFINVSIQLIPWAIIDNNYL